MFHVVLFEDNPNLGADVRREHMPAHLSFLDDPQLTGRITRVRAQRSGCWLVVPAPERRA
jgi:hypothetical protein